MFKLKLKTKTMLSKHAKSDRQAKQRQLKPSASERVTPAKKTKPKVPFSKSDSDEDTQMFIGDDMPSLAVQPQICRAKESRADRLIQALNSDLDVRAPADDMIAADSVPRASRMLPS